MSDEPDGVLYAPKKAHSRISSVSTRKSVADQKLCRAWVENNITMKEMVGDNVIETPTDAFGEIEFKGSTRRTKSKFIRLSDTTKPEVLYTLMTKHWNLAKPRLLISVTGGTERLILDPRLKQVFQSGLLKVAQTPGAWVITGGTNTGVMQHVGEALQGITDACIGMSSWGAVENTRSLCSRAGEERIGGKFPYQVGCTLFEEGPFLDQNHTHHLMVDNGNDRVSGAEVQYRLKFEKYVIDCESERVPAVLLLLEGGIEIIDTVWSAISNFIPVVIAEGSGGACDLIAYVLDTLDEVAEDEARMHEGIIEMIKSTFPTVEDEKLALLYGKLRYLVQMKQNFTVYELGGEMDFDECLLMALLTAHGSSHVDQLQLTLLWNRSDLAREKILSQNHEWQREDLRRAMILALAVDRVEFVKLLLEFGVNVANFLTNDVLEFLYGFASRTKSSTMSYQFEQTKETFVPANLDTLEDAHSTVNLLCRLECNTSPRAIPRKVTVGVINALCKRLMIQGPKDIIEDVSKSNIQNVGNDVFFREFEFPYRELFFWAVLNNKQDLALYFWEFEQEKMIKAMIAAEINTMLFEHGKKYDLSEDLLKSFSSNASVFRNLAWKILGECYETDEFKTLQLIQSELCQFPQLTCLEVAIQSGDLDFVSHSAVQILLDEVWTGDIVYRNVREWKLVVSFLFPPLINQLEFHQADDMEYDIDDDVIEECHESESNGSAGKEKLINEDRLVESCESFPDENQNFLEPSLPFFHKLYRFYFSTPITKFYASVISYLVFMLVFAYVSLLKKDHSIQPEELFLVVYVASLTTAEIRQVYQGYSKTLKGKLMEWYSSRWNILDATAIVLFFIAFGLRLHTDTIQIGHLLYSINGGFWVLRALRVFYVDPVLGPYVVMLWRMLRDLMYFLVILLVFLISYGVSSKSVLDPQPRGSSAFQLLKNIFFHPYFNIYGELFIDRDPQNNRTTRFGTPIVHAYAEPVAWFLLGVYLLVTNILLMNILIAIFNNTFNDVQEKSDKIWKFERVGLVTEYALRSPIAAPFSLFAHLFYLVRWFFRLCCAGPDGNTSLLRSSFSNEMKEELIEFENKCVASYLRKWQCESTENTLQDSVDSLLRLEHTSNELSEKIEFMKDEMKSCLDELRERLETIEGCCTKK